MDETRSSTCRQRAPHPPVSDPAPASLAHSGPRRPQKRARGIRSERRDGRVIRVHPCDPPAGRDGDGGSARALVPARIPPIGREQHLAESDSATARMIHPVAQAGSASCLGGRGSELPFDAPAVTARIPAHTIFRRSSEREPHLRAAAEGEADGPVHVLLLGLLGVVDSTNESLQLQTIRITWKSRALGLTADSMAGVMNNLVVFCEIFLPNICDCHDRNKTQHLNNVMT